MNVDKLINDAIKGYDEYRKRCKLIEKEAQKYIDFCDGDLCVSVVVEGKQADFHFEPVTLKMFAYAYKLHCEELKKQEDK